MGGSRVIVVEDEPEMLDIIQVNLEQAGYRVVSAQDGVEACGVLDVADCDAVILDLVRRHNGSDQCHPER